MNPALSLPRALIMNEYVVAEMEKAVLAWQPTFDKLRGLGKIIELWKQKTTCLIDEVDMILHPLRSELNFP